MILLIGGEKGGTGKTTLATNIAGILAKNNDVLLIDTDKQLNALPWSHLRSEDNSLHRVTCIALYGKELGRTVLDLKSKHEIIIIDAGGRDSFELRASMSVADKIIIPVQPSQLDLWTLENMSELVEQVQAFNPNLKAEVFISRVSTNPRVKEWEEAAEAIKELKNLGLIKSVTKDRKAYRDAFRQGKTVIELKPKNHDAIIEIEKLVKSIKEGIECQVVN